ncbi:hypothetical protein DFP72DRAFT_927118, partial [Ephemerocybe angulata]
MAQDPTPPETAEIRSIRKEIMSRREAMDVLRHELQALEAECKAYESLLAPMRRNVLPVEVLGDIFSLVVQMPETTTDSQVTTLCLVCKAWRDVALGTPSIWARVGEIEMETPLNVGKLRNWLSRARGHPRGLEVVGTRCMYEEHDEASPCPLPSTTMADFLASGPALDELSIKASSTKCMEELIDRILQPQSPSWNTIRAIHLGMSHWHISSGPRSWSLLKRLPPVTSLSLSPPSSEGLRENQLHQENNKTLEDLTLANLTTFRLTCDFPSSWILGRIGTGENLETLTLDFERSFRDDERTLHAFHSRVLLPRLRTLQVLQIADNSETQILRCLRMPALDRLDLCFGKPWRGLKLEAHDYPDMWELQADIISLVEGPNCISRLHHLRISNLPISSCGLLEVLLLLPSVTHLRLDNVGSDPIFFARVKDKNEQLLPRLQYLEILNSGHSFTPQEVFRFFEARKVIAAAGTSLVCLEELVMTVTSAKVFKGHPSNLYEVYGSGNWLSGP